MDNIIIMNRILLHFFYVQIDDVTIVYKFTTVNKYTIIIGYTS